MPLIKDKFNCIDPIADQDIMGVIENYLENYLYTGNRIILYNYILQIKYLDSFKLRDEKLALLVKEKIHNYLLSIRNNMRCSIKKDLFNLDSGLNKFLIDFKKKINFINKIITISNYDISKLLITIIIDDIYIKSIIDDNINNSIIITVCKILQNIVCDTIFCSFLNTLGDSYKKKIINTIDYDIPANIKSMIIINNTFNEIKFIRLNYNFLYNNELLVMHINKLIMVELINIIKSRNLYEINDIFFKLDYKIITYNELLFEDLKSELQLLMDYIASKMREIDLIDIINIIHFYTRMNPTNDIKNYAKQNWDNNFKNNLICIIDNEISVSNNIDKIKKLLDIILYINHFDNSLLEIYYEYLIKRMLYHYSDIVKFRKCLKLENIICDRIRHYKNRISYLILNIINDMKLSYDINNDCGYNSTYTPILSPIFDINSSEGYVSSNVINEMHYELASRLKTINAKYKKHYAQRDLVWLPHFGEINITFMNKEIILLPIQFMILELFNDNSTVDIMNCILLKNYSYTFRENIVKSFIKSNLLYLDNDVYKLNENITFNINLIEIFHECSNILDIWDTNRLIQLEHTHEEITMSQINHLLKKKSYNHQDLYDVLVNNITVFKLTKQIYDKTLEHMIEKDYIIKKETMYEKIYY
jgi:hypothetical protein